MRLPFRLLPLLALLAAASCTSDKQKALAFNNKLVAHNHKLEQMGFNWGQRFGVAMQTGDFTPLRGSADSLGTAVDEMIADVKQLDAVPGGEALKEAELRYLQFERDGFLKVARRFEALTPASTADSLQPAVDALKAMGEEENRNLATLKTLQAGFAQKYDLTVAPDKK